MIRIPEIVTAMKPLVGWQQDYDPSRRIADELTVSLSGLYYQQAHPLLTLENIRAIMPETFILQYPEWDKDHYYVGGEKVRYKDLAYLAIEASDNAQPDESPLMWKPFDIVSDFLAQQTEAGITQTVQTFLQEKGLLRETKELLERRTFFDGAGRLTNLQPNQGKLVGFEISPVRSMGVTTKIERIGLQMMGATGTVRVYLFHSSQVEPIYWQDLEFTKQNGGFQWFDMKDGWYLPYISDRNNSGGCWYLVYNQNDLPAGMQAVNATKDWSMEPCMTCNPGSVAAWRELTKYLLISPFKARAYETFNDFPEIWDIEDNVYTNTCNYGLNVEVSVGCDLTDFIIKQRDIFATVLQRQVAVNLLRAMAMNAEVRVNRNQSNVSAQGILYEIDGNPEGRVTGLGYELKKGYEALDINTRDIDRICLTCRPIGVRYRTV